jgi:hypothetical protein
LALGEGDLILFVVAAILGHIVVVDFVPVAHGVVVSALAARGMMPSQRRCTIRFIARPAAVHGSFGGNRGNAMGLPFGRDRAVPMIHGCRTGGPGRRR